MKLQTILLAEDSLADIEMTLNALKNSNIANRVVVVNDGVEAMEYLRCEGSYKSRKPGHPSVVLLDIKMPRMDGNEVLKAIRADPALKMLPVVMLTSSREDQDLLKSYSLGVNAYVVKPVDFKQFTNTVCHIGIFWSIINEFPPLLT